MVEKTLAKIEAAIKKVRTADPKNKRELIKLLQQLKTELRRQQKSDDLLKTAREGLRESTVEFEASHPKLAQAVNEISTMLASMGI